MTETIASIFSVSSLVAILYMIGNKLPTLSSLDITGYPHNAKEAGEALRMYVQNSKQIQTVFSPDLYLQKVLSQTRVFTLRFEQRLGVWLEQSRRRSQDRENKFTEGYWGELRKETKKVLRKRSRV